MLIIKLLSGLANVWELTKKLVKPSGLRPFLQVRDVVIRNSFSDSQRPPPEEGVMYVSPCLFAEAGTCILAVDRGSNSITCKECNASWVPTRVAPDRRVNNDNY
jgi:hypothetical protein